MSDIQTLVGKALTDEDFAQQLLNNPTEVLQEHGIEPDEEMLTALSEVDVEGLRSLATAFSEEGKAA